MAEVVVALLISAWVAGKLYVRKQKKKAEKNENSKKEGVTSMVKKEIQDQVEIQVRNLEQIVQSQLLQLMQMPLMGNQGNFNARNNPASQSTRALTERGSCGKRLCKQDTVI